MTQVQRRISALMLGGVLVLLMLLLAGLDGRYQPEPPELRTLTAVNMYQPPPPPPPLARADESAADAGPPMALNAETEVVLDMMSLDVDLQAGRAGQLGSGIQGLGEGEGANWGATGLSELDTLPQVLSAPPFHTPDIVRKQGITQMNVRIHIIIDENGEVLPVSVIETPFPELNDQVLDYAAAVRFSKPTRLGIPVRTQYIWPVNFNFVFDNQRR